MKLKSNHNDVLIFYFLFKMEDIYSQGRVGVLIHPWPNPIVNVSI